MLSELEVRKRLARQLLSANMERLDFENKPDPAEVAVAAGLAADLAIPFPQGTAPVPQPLPAVPALDAPLPKADVVVITWTVDEVKALADVLTPKTVRDKWYRYARNWAQYVPKIRKGAPSLAVQRLASYFPTKIGTKSVLCMKSELHLNQDGIQQPPHGAPGNASLPVKDLFTQIIEEVQPKLVITAGTAGGVFSEHDLGDVVVTRGAKFYCRSEFGQAPFNQRDKPNNAPDGLFRSDWQIPMGHFPTAVNLMKRFRDQISEPEFLPPTVNYGPLDHIPKPLRPNDPDLKVDGVDMPAFHPILTTDFFEFGTSANRLDRDGCAVEMGDAVLALVVDERRKAGKSTPDWLVIRNCSDPQINGALAKSLQTMWAVYYYQQYGYWTSVMSSLACWAVIAGL